MTDAPERTPEPHSATAPVRAVAWVAVGLRFLVVPALVAAAVWAGLHMTAFDTGGPVVDLVPTDAPALKAEAEARRLFKVPAGSDVAVVQRDPNGLSDATQQRIAQRAKQVADNPGPSLKLALPIVNLKGQVPGSREDTTTAVTFLVFDPGTAPVDRERVAHSYLDRFNQSEDAPVGVTGVTPARLDQGRLILDRLDLLELLTLVGVALIVVFTLRSIGAAVVTLAAVAVTFPITIWALGAVSDRLDVSLPQEMQPLVVALLLGVVTDYTVFFLSDFRDRLPGHSDSAACARAAAREVIPIVFTGGLILAISLLALRASSLSFFADLGPTLAVTVLVAMAVSVVFVPALIGLLGRFAIWPAGRGREAGSPDEAIRSQSSGIGRRVAYLVAGRPVAAMITLLCVAGLLVAGSGLRHIGLGIDLMSGLPADSEVKKAATAAEQGFAPGVLAPTELILKSSSGPLSPDALVALQQALADQPGVAGTLGPADPAAVGEESSFFVTDDGAAARYVVILRDDPLGAGGIDDYDRLRDRMPQLLADSGLDGASVAYAGQTALASNTVAAVRGDAFKVAGVVIAINLLLLILFMRALPAPLVLLVANVLSVGAALGLTVWLFQDLLGNPDITYYVPFASAVLLVALSSDYNVLVAGRIWHEAGRRRRLREAIAEAAPRASRAIRAAGLALAVSFALVAVIPVEPFRQLAVAMVIGILLETYIVRPLLAPGLIALLGRFSGWPGRPGWANGPQPSAAREPQRAQTESDPM